MTVIAPPSLGNGLAPAVPADLIWRLSVDQYHDMIRAGILTEDDPVELLEGWLVYKMTKNPPHSAATKLVEKALERCLPTGWHVNTQTAITLDTSEPEPDVVVVRGEIRDYVDRHPGPQDLGLVVEVADTSLNRDRGWKKRLYARAGIPVYWILNLPENRLEVYAAPSGPAEQPDYRDTNSYGPADTVHVVIGGREIGRVAVSELLP